MKIGVVNTKSFMTSGYRIDPDIHLSEGAAVRKQLRNLPYELTNVGECASKVFLGNIFSRIFVKDKAHGVPYLAASDTVLSNIKTGRFLAKKQANELSYLMLKKDWILITCSGTLGNVTYTNSTFENHIATHDLIRVVPNDVNVNKGTLYAFLAGKYGYYQITQSQFGGVVKHINDAQASSIIVPVLPDHLQKDVNSLIQEAATLREEATDSLDKAIEYFNKKYAIRENITSTFTKNVQDLKFSFAAYNNNIEVDDFIREFSANATTLENATLKIFAPPMFKHIYLDKDNGYPFMTGSELTKFNMRYYRWLSPRGVKDINDYVVNQGTLLLYKSGTTDGGILGNVFIADKALNGCCLSDHVIRVVFKDTNLAYWAYAFLKSDGAIKLLQRLATGTMIPFITSERLSKVLIPNPDENYNKIVALVDTYIEKNSLSKLKENQAISMVEQEIEKWNK
jgi:hypothetical protein